MTEVTTIAELSAQLKCLAAAMLAPTLPKSTANVFSDLFAGLAIYLAYKGGFT